MATFVEINKVQYTLITAHRALLCQIIVRIVGKTASFQSKKIVILQHDNVLPQTSVVVKIKLVELGFELRP